MAQFPFQNAILKIESKKKERALVARFSFARELAMKKNLASDAGTDLSVLRRRITELVARNAVAMVQQAIDAVNEEGQYQAIKYLFEMVGLYPMSDEDAGPAEDSLAETLLHRLGLLEDKVPEPSPRKKECTGSDPLK